MSRKSTTPQPPPDDDASDPLFGNGTAETTKAPLKPSTEIVPGGFADEGKTSIARRGFEEMETSMESIAVGAQIRAEIAARTIHAMQHARSFDDARIAILKDCDRPAFAKAAIYRKPVGGSHIEGLSIRFAESALRHWGNVSSQAIVLYDGPDKRVVRIGLTDLESNTTHARDIVLLKQIERKDRSNRNVIGERVNSSGQIVYVVEATEDELATKEAAARSKVMRNEGLRLLPADILDEATKRCKATRSTADAKDPDEARKEILDAFAENLSILPARLEEFLGCPVAECGPAQLGELREVYRAVRDGDATLAEFISARASDISSGENGGEEKPSSAVTSLKERARAKATERKEKKP